MFGHRISGSCLLRDGALYGSSSYDDDDEAVAVGSCFGGFRTSGWTFSFVPLDMLLRFS